MVSETDDDSSSSSATYNQSFSQSHISSHGKIPSEKKIEASQSKRLIEERFMAEEHLVKELIMKSSPNECFSADPN